MQQVCGGPHHAVIVHFASLDGSLAGADPMRVQALAGRSLVAASAVFLAAWAAAAAMATGDVVRYAVAASLLVVATSLLRPGRALLALVVVLVAHALAGVQRAGAMNFSAVELLALTGWPLLAAGAALVPRLAVMQRRWLAVPAVLLAGCAFLLALTGQRHAFHPITRSSVYVPMADGVRLAVDWYLPRGLPDGQALPTIVTFTRYHRATALRFPFNVLFSRSSGNRERLAAAGYASVVVDVRGAGASTGRREAEFSPEEVSDSVAVVDWIIRQPWSNGIVGAEGVSYSATAAELLMLEAHPAVRAIAAQYALFDSYSEAALPGGLVNRSIARGWQSLLEALDRNEPIPGMEGIAALAWKGVAPVEGQEAVLQQALEEHRANRYIDLAAGDIEYRDARIDGRAGFLYAPAGHLERYRDSETPLLLVSGWADGAYQLGALRKFRNRASAATHVVIGPWNHGPGAVTDPCAGDLAYRGRRSDLTLPFFDHYLKGVANGFDQQPAIRYFTYCANRWNYAQRWPPAEELRVLALDGETLAAEYPDVVQHRRLDDDRAATTGNSTRWRSLVAWQIPTRYPDRKDQAAHGLAWISEPLDQSVVVTGHPKVTVTVAGDARDAALFAYLEEVAPDGTVTYVTEGQLRLLHRATRSDLFEDYIPVRSFSRADAAPLEPGMRYRIELGLYPVSYRFRAGHRIRLLLTRADADNFLPLSSGAGAPLDIYSGPREPSLLALPVESTGLQRWERGK